MLKKLKIDSEIIIKVPLKAVSFQQHKFGRGQVYKTEYQKHFIDDLNKVLLNYKQNIFKFLSGHKTGNVIAGQWIFLYKNFFVKNGSINSKICDLDNGKKMVQDVIFKSLGLDDGLIVFSSDIRWQAKSDMIILKLVSCPKDSINENILEFYNSTVDR